MLWLTIPTILLYWIHYIMVIRNTGPLTADNIFIISQFIMMVGSLTLLDMSVIQDIDYAYIISYTLPLYILASTIVFILFGRKPIVVKSFNDGEILPKTIYFLLYLSIAIVFLYFFAVGYSILAVGINAILSGTSQDFASLRLGSYTGDVYFFPGYVNQFKNILLPSSVVIIIVHLYQNRKKHRLIVSFFLILIALVSILSTGQRGAFISFLITLSIFMYFKYRKVFFKYIIIVSLITFPIILLSTLVLNRSNVQQSIYSDPGTVLSSLIDELGNRILEDNQTSAVVGFRYVYDLRIPVGSEWIEGLYGILPNHSGSDLSGKIFQVIYGTTRGTSPIGLWGSIYYNFGKPGTLIFPVLLGIIFQITAIYLTKGKNLNSIQLIGMAGVFATFGTWIAESPQILLNSGLLSYILLYYIGSKEAKKRSKLCLRQT